MYPNHLMKSSSSLGRPAGPIKKRKLTQEEPNRQYKKAAVDNPQLANEPISSGNVIANDALTASLKAKAAKYSKQLTQVTNEQTFRGLCNNIYNNSSLPQEAKDELLTQAVVKRMDFTTAPIPRHSCLAPYVEAAQPRIIEKHLKQIPSNNFEASDESKSNSDDKKNHYYKKLEEAKNLNALRGIKHNIKNEGKLSEEDKKELFEKALAKRGDFTNRKMPSHNFKASNESKSNSDNKKNQHSKKLEEATNLQSLTKPVGDIEHESTLSQEEPNLQLANEPISPGIVIADDALTASLKAKAAKYSKQLTKVENEQTFRGIYNKINKDQSLPPEKKDELLIQAVVKRMDFTTVTIHHDSCLALHEEAAQPRIIEKYFKQLEQIKNLGKVEYIKKFDVLKAKIENDKVLSDKKALEAAIKEVEFAIAITNALEASDTTGANNSDDKKNQYSKKLEEAKDLQSLTKLVGDIEHDIMLSQEAKAQLYKKAIVNSAAFTSILFPPVDTQLSLAAKALKGGSEYSHYRDEAVVENDSFISLLDIEQESTSQEENFISSPLPAGAHLSSVAEVLNHRDEEVPDSFISLLDIETNINNLYDDQDFEESSIMGNEGDGLSFFS